MPGAPTCAQACGSAFALTSPGGVGDGWVQTFTAMYGGEGLDGTYDGAVQDVTVDLPPGWTRSWPRCEAVPIDWRA